MARSSKKAPKPLTARQRALVRNLAKGMSITAAAAKAGYTAKHMGQVGHQAIEGIKLKMPELLDSSGLTDQALIEDYIKPGLEAIETKFAQFEGKFTDSIGVIAWEVRHKFLDTTFRVKGSYAAVKEAIRVEDRPLAIQINTNVNLPDA